MPEYAGVHLLENPYFIDRAFDYFITPELRGTVHLGDFVTVPFGTANHKRIGLVVSLKNRPDQTEIGCKPILSVCDPEISLNEEMTALCFFIKEQTLCTVGGAVRAMIPASALAAGEVGYLTASIKKVSVTTVTLDKENITLTEGEEETLTATVKPDNATEPSVVWESDNTDVATVEGGVVIAKDAGKATITATADGVSATCTVVGVLRL